MPSRPVLIGRGLVPTTYKTTHAHPHRWRARATYVTPRATNEHTLFASTTQFPTNKPVPHHTVCGGLRGLKELRRP